MKLFKVNDMHCEKCVSRITAALGAEHMRFEVKLADRTVAVEDERADEAAGLLDDLGFTAEEAD
ncbi:MAG: metal-binding protein [Clostridia bacterium]|nr:metal-binding protein [Clostridia bacterium]